MHTCVHVCACAYGNYRLGVSCLYHLPPCFLRQDLSLNLLIRPVREPVIFTPLPLQLCTWVLGIRIYSTIQRFTKCQVPG